VAESGLDGFDIRKNCSGLGKNSKVKQQDLGFIRLVKAETTLERGGNMAKKPQVILATRGSGLALAQTRMMGRQCQTAFPNLDFDIKVIKTTGDKLQTAALFTRATRSGFPFPKRFPNCINLSNGTVRC
jgi:porphobilinogen deaminase-like protein